MAGPRLEDGVGRIRAGAPAERAAGEQAAQRAAGKAEQAGERDPREQRRAGSADVRVGGAQLIFGLEHVRPAQQDVGIEPGGHRRDRRRSLVDRTRQQARIDRRADQQLQRVDVLRDRGPLLREIGLRLRQDLLAWSRSVRGATPPSSRMRVSRTLFCALAAVCGDQQQAEVRRVVRARRWRYRATSVRRVDASAGLGREILLELGVGQRTNAAEQVELEARDAEAELILAAPSVRSILCRRCDASTPALASSCGKLLRALDSILLARRGDV